MRSTGLLRLNIGVTLLLPLAIFSSPDEGVVPAAAFAAAARPKDGVRIPPLRGREVDGVWFPDGVTGWDPGATGKGIIKPSVSFLTGEELCLSERVVLTGNGIADGRDKVREALFGDGETRRVDDFSGLGSAGRSAKGMAEMDESASRGITLVIFDLVAGGAGVRSPEAGEECTCNVPSLIN